MHMHCSSKAMIKCMLNSPVSNSANDSTLFSNIDFHSLTGLGKNRAAAAEASNWMQYADLFLDAYSVLDADQKSKVVNAMEIRMVMHVQGKRSETRSSFGSLLDIASKFYEEAKALDTKLPRWNKLPLKQDSNVASTKAGSRIREISGDTVQDYILNQKGFHVGSTIVKVATKQKYTISAFDSNLKTVRCEAQVDEDGEEEQETQEPLEVSRFELIDGSTWQTFVVKKPTFMTSMPSPIDHTEFKQSVIAGMVKHSLGQEFSKSHESHTTLQTAPEQKVFVNKAFKRENSFKLVGLTASISVQKLSATLAQPWLCIGTAGKDLKIWAKGSNNIGSSERDAFISKYWNVFSTHDQSKVNCIYSSKQLDFKVWDIDVCLQVPLIVNSKCLDEEDEIIVLKRSVEEPPAKKPKVDTEVKPKPKAKGKAKAKAKK